MSVPKGSTRLHYPVVVPVVTLKPVCVSSVRVSKDRMLSGERIEGSLSVPKTSACMELLRGARRQTEAIEYLSVIEIE